MITATPQKLLKNGQKTRKIRASKLPISPSDQAVPGQIQPPPLNPIFQRICSQCPSATYKGLVSNVLVRALYAAHGESAQY